MKETTVMKKLGLQDCILLKKNTSRLGGQILQFEKQNGKIVFLKTGKGIAAESLSREMNALIWLKDKKIKIPKVLQYYKDNNNGIAYLLITKLEGNAAQKVTDLDQREIIKIAAQGLKKFHLISKKNGQNLTTLDDDLNHIEKCVKYNLIKMEEFKKNNNGKTPEEICLFLAKNKHKFSNNVLVHGDYCLPNLMISDNSCGFLDVADCGPGDPYKDYSAMEGSISRNFGDEWVDIFYQYSGVKKVDKFKIEYFKSIDQFSYHLNVNKYIKFNNELNKRNDKSNRHKLQIK